jgi:hypothetical protein
MIFQKEKYLGLGLFLFLSFIFYSCQSGKKEVDSLRFEPKLLEKDSCLGNECTRVRLAYPYFVGDGESSDFLNAHVEQQMVMFLNIGESQEIVPLDSAVSSFLNSYLEFKKEFDSPQEWEITVDAKVTLQCQKMICIAFDTFSFTGGAHPNSYRMYLNFDLNKNSPVKNEDLVLDKANLMRLAESKFKKYYDVDELTSLSEDNRFFLENGKDFFLPAAMGFEDEEFVLYYNPYEIGPYVMGPTELRFTMEEVKGLVRIPCE